MSTPVDKIQKLSCCVVWFSVFMGHPKLDLYVGKYRLGVIFHFSPLLTALVPRSQCYATVVLYYTCDIACQIVFPIQFFKFTFTLLASPQLHWVLLKVFLLFSVRGGFFFFLTFLLTAQFIVQKPFFSHSLKTVPNSTAFKIDWNYVLFYNILPNVSHLSAELRSIRIE